MVNAAVKCNLDIKVVSVLSALCNDRNLVKRSFSSRNHLDTPFFRASRKCFNTCIVFESNDRLEQFAAKVCLLLDVGQRTEVPCTALGSLCLYGTERLTDGHLTIGPYANGHGVDEQTYKLIDRHLSIVSTRDDLHENGILCTVI